MKNPEFQVDENRQKISSPRRNQKIDLVAMVLTYWYREKNMSFLLFSSFDIIDYLTEEANEFCGQQNLLFCLCAWFLLIWPAI